PDDPGRANRARRVMRPSERILAGYYVYATLLALALPARPGVVRVAVALNLAVLAALACLAWADDLRRGRLLGTIRDWFPLPLLLLAYRQMGWLAPSSHTFELERRWIVWDRLLLRDMGLRAAIESLGPLLPSVLEMSYLLVYAIPAGCLATLYILGRRDRVDALWVTLLLGTLLAYAQFPFWPSEPPRVVFPGEDAPAIDTLFRRLNWQLLGGYGIHTSVFPSAHVSSAFAASFAMRRALPERRGVSRFLAALAVSIAIATVYGRYHYAVDAVAGFAVAVTARYIASWRRAISSQS
ncbi:MAG: phosphatase PAP2 family protein, partial [Bryobacteraceae bacterium]